MGVDNLLSFSAVFQSTWALVVLGAITIALSAISVILSVWNWVVVYLITIQECQDISRIFHKYRGKKFITIFYISLIGLAIMCLLFLLYVKSMRQDKSYVDTYYFGWVCSRTENNACTSLMTFVPCCC